MDDSEPSSPEPMANGTETGEKTSQEIAAEEAKEKAKEERRKQLMGDVHLLKKMQPEMYQTMVKSILTRLLDMSGASLEEFLHRPSPTPTPDKKRGSGSLFSFAKKKQQNKGEIFVCYHTIILLMLFV